MIFNDQQIVDLTAFAGNYVMVAMILAMAEQIVPPDREEPFKPGEDDARAIVMAGLDPAIHHETTTLLIDGCPGQARA